MSGVNNIFFSIQKSLFQSSLGIFFIANSVVFSGLLSFLILISFYEYVWIPSDDSVFAYVAERLNAGAIFGVDVYDTHGGYQHFLNAWLFKIFGSDMVVLRYPMIVIGVLQAMIATYLCKKHGWLVSVLAGYSVTIFSFVMFPSPAPNLYGLFFAFVATFLLTRYQSSLYRNTTLGFLIGICLMFRHPTAIFIGFGVLAYYIYESGFLKKNSLWLTRLSIILISLGLLTYLYLAYEFLAFVMYGLWSFFALLFLWFKKYGVDTELYKKIVWSLAGFMSAILPMVVYQRLHGDIYIWFSSTFMSGPAIFTNEILSNLRYWQVPYSYFLDLSSQPFNFLGYLTVGMRFALFLIPISVGVFLIYRFYNNKPIPPIVFITIFYGYVSIYIQLVPYFYFTLPLFIVSIFTLVRWSDESHKTIITILVFIVSIFWFFMSILSPFTVKKGFIPSEIPNLSVYISPDYKQKYTEVLELIETYSHGSSSIYVMPNLPEIYYLSNNVSLFPFFNSTFYVNTPERYDQVKFGLETYLPNFIIFQPRGYFGMYDERILSELQSSGHYKYYKTIGDLEIYISNQVVINSDDFQ